VGGNAVGVRENGEDRIKAAIADMNAGINYVEVVEIVHAAPGIDDGCFRIVAHAACAGLMLAAAKVPAREVSPGLDSAGFLEPGFRFRGHEVGNFHRV